MGSWLMIYLEAHSRAWKGRQVSSSFNMYVNPGGPLPMAWCVEVQAPYHFVGNVEAAERRWRGSGPLPFLLVMVQPLIVLFGAALSRPSCALIGEKASASHMYRLVFEYSNDIVLVMA